MKHEIYIIAYTRGANPMPVPIPTSRPREAKLFRKDGSQAVRIPVEFELPGDRVLIRREAGKLIIEPVTNPTNIIELLAEWRKVAPLAPADQFPEIEDTAAKPEDIF